MATVNKNFRIKNGLVVEGSTATVNGNNILTENGGDQYILNLIGGETLVKSVSSDFTVTGGGQLQVNNSSDLARTGDITSAINALDTDDIEEGSSNQYFTTSRARDAFNAGSYIGITNGTIDVNVAQGGGLGAAQGYLAIDRTTVDTWYDAAGAAATAQSNAEDYADGLASNYDPAGSASTAQSNANTYTNTQLNDYTKTSDLDTTIDGYGYLKSADLSGYATETYANTAASNAQSAAEDYADSLASNYDIAGAASTAEANANTYTDNAINALDTDDIEEGANNLYFTNTRARGAISAGTGISYDNGTGVVSVDNTIATQTFVTDAIDNLIDGAPGLLDTLNEIAAAINDDANYFTTVANAINAKQDALTAGSNINIDGSNVISVTGLDTDDVTEGSNLYFTNQRVYDAIDINTPGLSVAMPEFTEVTINDVAKQIAATTGNIVTAAATTAFSWAKADYRSGKFTVKVKNGSHTELSEILVTLDTSDNVAITEYGIIGTNGSLSTVSADVSGLNVRIIVTPVNNNSEVMVSGTLLI